MKIKSLVLCLFFLMAFSASVQAITTTVNVTTTADEYGENLSACSLREAVKSVRDKRAFGGCSAGGALQTNVIQLGAGIYNLTQGQLLLDFVVTIAGKDTLQADVVDPYTGKKPNRLRPDDLVNGTFIRSTANNRLILTTANLILKDLVLQGNGTVHLADNNGNGGVLYSTADLSLDNVVVKNGKVEGSGGAIFMASNGSILNVTDSFFDTNTADKQGGVVAMACAEGLTPYLAHTVSITRALFLSNVSTMGAAAIEVCGNTTATVTASTFSGNNSGASSLTSAITPSAAIAYQLPGTAPNSIGSLSLSYITAVNNNEFLVVSGISMLTVSGSLIAFNAGGGCVAGAGTVPPAIKYGEFNATDSAGCMSLLNASTSNVLFAGRTRPDELSTLANHGGLTDTYLPALGSQYVLDAGDALSNCVVSDQRNLFRQSGGNASGKKKCDIGAVERLQVMANDDEALTKAETDRLAIVDVLYNDTFAESDSSPLGYDEPAVHVDVEHFVVVPAIPATPTTPAVPAVMGSCIWHPDLPTETNESYRGRLVIDNGGVVTTDDAPVKCTYHVVSNGVSSLPATVSVNVKNAVPNAVNDVYVRPQGAQTISFNPLTNDNDDGDGVWGKQTPVWADYPIYIVSKPTIGTVTGADIDRCPDWTSLNLKNCYKPPLTYTATNGQSPFSDSFTYAVYDSGGKVSKEATVTIQSDAPDPDKGQTGGSLDILGGLILALLGLRRTRRL